MSRIFFRKSKELATEIRQIFSSWQTARASSASDNVELLKGIKRGLKRS
jgi:hypothetical protein